MTLILIILGIVILSAFYIMSVYNGLQTLKTRIEASIQEIGNQLKRQANLIPNLQESVKGYLKHEKDIFDKLTAARMAVETAAKDATGKTIDAAMERLNSVLPQLRVVLEDNPEIKGDSVVQNLMNELRDTADKLMYARRTLIDLTADYNVKLVAFPSNIVANLFSFKKEKGLEVPSKGEHLSVSESETKDVKVDLN